MRKKVLTLSATALMFGGLVACNTDEGAMGTRNADNARPIGYYSNENNNRGLGDRNGNAYTLDDNDGPLTEIFDRNGNKNGNNNARYDTLNRDNNNGNDNNRAGIFNRDNNNDNGTGIFNRDNDNGRNNTILNRDRNLMDDNVTDRNNNNRYSRGDANYHSHLNGNNDRVESSGFYNNYEGDLARRITDRAKRVENVDDVRAVVMGDEVVVAIDTDDTNDIKVRDEVRNAVKSLAKGKNINVLTDEATFSRVRNLDNDIREGNRRDTINADMNDLFENIGDTIRRPFTNNNNR